MLSLIEFYIKTFLCVIPFRILALLLHALTIVDIFSDFIKVKWCYLKDKWINSIGNCFYHETTDLTTQKQNTQDFTILYLNILLKIWDIKSFQS